MNDSQILDFISLYVIELNYINNGFHRIKWIDKYGNLNITDGITLRDAVINAKIDMSAYYMQLANKDNC